MATPSIPFPFYMTPNGAADPNGTTSMLVQDINGYNAALGMGYAIPATVTTDTPINAQQPDSIDTGANLP